MINIIKFELYKISRRKSIYFMFILITLLILLSAIYNNSKGSDYKYINWKIELKEKNEEYENQINSSEIISDEIKLIFQDDIKLNNFYLNNNINPYECTSEKFINESSSYIVLCIIYIVILATLSISNEFKNGTIELLVTKKYTRTNIFFSKFISLMIVAIILSLYTITISFIIGFLFFNYKIGIKIPIDTINGIKTIPFIKVILFKYIAYMITFINFTVLAFSISSIFANYSFSHMITFAILSFGSYATNLLKGTYIYKYLFFTNIDILPYLGAYNSRINDLTLGMSIVKSLLYIIILLSVSSIIFNRKKISIKF